MPEEAAERSGESCTSEMDEEAAALAATSEAVQQFLSPLLLRHADSLGEVLAPITEAVARHNADIARSLAALSSVEQSIKDALPDHDISWIASQREEIEASSDDLLAGVRKAIREGNPPNWEDLDDHLKFSELFEMAESGLPVAWVPRSSVLAELLAVAADDRPGVFAARGAQIVEDCRAVLEDVTSTRLADHADMLDKALSAAEAGHLAAAQSLAASVFDSVLRHAIQPRRISGYYARVKSEVREFYENADRLEICWAIVHVAALPALDIFDHSRGDSVPARFNRHASAHAVGRKQYTPANAFIALALAASLVRQAQEEIDYLDAVEVDDQA